jgi:GNAT superfamily N-acetyltransferase
MFGSQIMITFTADPPLCPKPSDALFAQTIQLKDGDRTLGQARWCITALGHGVVQILELTIEAKHRRAGHGRRLMRELIQQARACHQSRGESLRRLWIGVGHKSQIIGRSFLTAEGFHHVATTAGLLRDEDLLIYVKSLD